MGCEQPRFPGSASRPLDRSAAVRFAAHSRLRASFVAAALLSAALPPRAAFAQNPSSTSATAEQRFFEGQKLYSAQKYHEALEHFRASFEVLPSPNSQLYVARCLRELGQHAEAYEAYTGVLSATEGSAKYEGTNKAASEEREALASKVGRLTIDVPPGVDAKVRVGRRTIDSSMFGREIVVDAGEASVHAEATGRQPFDWRGLVQPGASQRVQVDLGGAPPPAPPPPPPPPPDTGGGGPGAMRTLAIVSAGVGVAGFATFAILGLKASSRYDELEKKCIGRCGPEDQEAIDAGRLESAISTVGLVVGVAGVGGAVALWILGAPKPEPRASSGVTVRVSPTGAWIGGGF